LRAHDAEPVDPFTTRHIVESRAATGRDKDRLFLAMPAEALRELLGREEE